MHADVLMIGKLDAVIELFDGLPAHVTISIHLSPVFRGLKPTLWSVAEVEDPFHVYSFLLRLIMAQPGQIYGMALLFQSASELAYRYFQSLLSRS